MSARLANRHFQLLAALVLAFSTFLFPFNASSASVPGFSVTFYSNVPGQSYTPVTQTSNTSAQLDSFSTMGFSYPNYYFEAWNTQPNGSGGTYADSATYAFTSDVNLYAQWIQVSHSVVFYRNLSSTDLSDAIETNNSPSSFESISNLGFIDPNHSFVNWTTQRDGTGTAFADQYVFPFVTGLVLYAQWALANETLVFSANGGAGSVDPQTVQYGNTTSVPTQGAMTKTGYSFVGWNTNADGSGTEYTPGAQLAVSANETIYAQWSLDTETLNFSSNGGVGTVNSQTAPYESSMTLPSGDTFSKADYSFVGWNTLSNGSGTELHPGAQLALSTGETLFAQWSRNTYVVHFTVPYLTSTVAPISVAAGDSTHLRSVLKLSRPGFSVSGWFTLRIGGKFVGKSGTVFSPTKSTTLYARWTENPLVKLVFSSNGGVGRVAARQVRAGLPVTVSSGKGIHRTGFEFRGWASGPHMSVPTVRIGVRFVLTRTKVLYALWRRDLPANTPQVLLGSVGVFATNSTTLTHVMRKYIAALADGINLHNRTRVLLYGYATGADSKQGSSLLALQRALAVQKQLNLDLASLNDVGVSVHSLGEGRLTNSVLVSFRNVEVFAN